VPHPSGTVTFLFTDIEGSTRLWEEQTQAMQAALARHDAILRRAIESHDGYVFKTVGDAFCAAFATALDCLRASLDAQLALAAEPWAVSGGIRVRMGFHTGVAEERDADYFGQAVNRTARLQGVGHGGQVLVSLVSTELLRDALPRDVTLRDIGLHRLKDLMRPEKVFQVCHPGLRAEFPPLKTLDNHPNNLPLQPTPFLGRAQELRSVSRMIEDGSLRAVTLTGPGGTGKTRLALQAAAEASELFDDGLFFVDLSGVTEHAGIVPAVIRGLEIKESGGRGALELLRDFAHHRRILLILDNLEQIPEAGAGVVEILSACPTVKLLATSREALHLRGEQVFPVPVLSTPPVREASRMELSHLHQFEAVTLFIERAQAVRPDFEATSANAPAIAEICARLDGLPLAIELAAARVNLLTPRDILARLGRRLSLLTGGLADLPRRQRTLRAAIDWSYVMLSPSEQSLVRELSVFAGGASLEAVEEVCGGCASEEPVVDVLASLAAKSLVGREERRGGTRFTMLESIREYAQELLAKAGGAEALEEAHARWYLAAAARARAASGPDIKHAFDELEDDLDNHLRALDWTGRAGRCAERLALCAALGRFWRVRGHLRLGLDCSRRALEACGEPSEERAEVLGSAGCMASDLGDYAEALGLLRQCAEACGSAGNTAGIDRADLDLGEIHRCAGDFQAARELLASVLARTKDEHLRAEAENNLGLLEYQEGKLDVARVFLERSRADLDRIGDIALAAAVNSNIGIINEQENRLDEARSCYSAAHDVLSKLGDRTALVILENNLGFLHQKSGELREALECYRGMWANASTLGNLRMVILAEAGMADALTGLGETENAFMHAQRAFDSARDLGPCLELAVAMRARGGAALAAGRSIDAANDLQACIPLLEKFGDREGADLARRGLERIHVNNREKSQDEKGG
jgi:predicted ATPase/class 3 adenylate cyclase